MSPSGQTGLRQPIIDICRAMTRACINQGIAGNLSVRNGSSLAITPTSLPYERMQPEDIVETRSDGSFEDRTACLLGHHGQIALDEDLAKAFWRAIEVETLAKMYLVALNTGEPQVLPEEEIARVIEQICRMGYGHPPNDEPAESRRI